MTIPSIQTLTANAIILRRDFVRWRYSVVGGIVHSLVERATEDNRVVFARSTLAGLRRAIGEAHSQRRAYC